MKALIALLFAMLLSLHKCGYCGYSLPSNRDDCTKSELQSGFTHCCYETYKVLTVSTSVCVPITDDQYKNIGDYIDNIKKGISSVGDFSFDCNSNYIALSLLSLLLLLF
jgi:hypothetical protein